MTDETEGRQGGKLRLALYLSLALNLLFVGLVVGRMAGGHPFLRGGMMGPDVGFGPITESLSHADRRELFRRFRTVAPDYRAMRDAVRADFAALAAVLQAESWDPAAAAAILDRQAEQSRDRMVKGRQVFLDYLGSLSAEDRRDLGARIAAEIGKRP
ncbi:periplasmic heavy metal sensor [Frigidibacter sp. RF13]|uniref:periplasmic heavy metal sensor n=1 Tax=Frigidibacter sp. RF13 TaxID=2997340 RepID=UPI00226F0A51|nr:periplasmic heavy metal sensor [Frigidibacter sp. RF13]MCY1126321.1 periplasmic heavy metal sensor [Frigidibacter sp. RF13]